MHIDYDRENQIFYLQGNVPDSHEMAFKEIWGCVFFMDKVTKEFLAIEVIFNGPLARLLGLLFGRL